ncbi:MAG: Hpt domain-containing protein [Patescibacteria group bacterium]
MSVDLKTYLPFFVQTTRKLVEEMDAQYKALLRDKTDFKALGELYRLSHSLMGQAHFMNFTELSQTSHMMSQVFRALLDAKKSVEPETITDLNIVISAFRQNLDNIERNLAQKDMKQSQEILQKITTHFKT